MVVGFGEAATRKSLSELSLTNCSCTCELRSSRLSSLVVSPRGVLAARAQPTTLGHQNVASLFTASTISCFPASMMVIAAFWNLEAVSKSELLHLVSIGEIDVRHLAHST